MSLLSEMKRSLKNIEEKYGISWQRFYYLAEVSNNWKSLLEKATPEEILDDLVMLFELDEEYKKTHREKPSKTAGREMARLRILKELYEKTLTEMPTSRIMALKSPVFKLLWSGTVM